MEKGSFAHPMTMLLFDLTYREETLLNDIKSITRNGRSIVLTAALTLILVYLFSIVGYIIFKDDFILTVDRISNKVKYEKYHIQCGSGQICAFHCKAIPPCSCTGYGRHSCALRVYTH
ncbi:inositol 1,4,5-trisphosphate receptor type 1-like [Xyrauchen texanus]|uniref:inositol 1,4,5-trisphosphate receptor type 1-like n=1 Tax=Xyrauchen texanus TaxID=154827 RepID=UPI0022429B36|nr:inositol 1,4,5-trisphosphate receptor type 1-like [Xyrauchen texanus]